MTEVPSASPMTARVAVVGLGSMGGGVARTLARHDVAVVGCDPRPAAREAFAETGRTAVASADALPDALDVLLLFVLNAAQAHEALRQGLDRVAPDGVVLCCVTVSPADAEALAAMVTETGRLYLDAPVSGGAIAAAEGRLSVMASGAPAAFDRARTVLDRIAATVWTLGDRAGAGSTVKMINQLLAGVHIATAAEAMALAIRAGADPATVYEVIGASAGGSWMWQNRVPHILEGDDTPRSAVEVFVKDLGIVLDAGRALRFPLPLAAAAHQLFLAAAAAGHGDRDDAFVIRVWEALAGIALPPSRGGSG